MWFLLIGIERMNLADGVTHLKSVEPSMAVSVLGLPNAASKG